MCFQSYHEPFAGSAALFFELQPRRASLSDRNADLIQFYLALCEDPHSVVRELETLLPDEVSYYAVRALKTDGLSVAQKASRFLYLNHYCFNSVYRTNRQGAFNVPYGKRRGPLPSKELILRASEQLKQAVISCTDFQHALHTTVEGDFVYLDPPFSSRVSSRYGEYGYGSFSALDEGRLIETVRELSKRGAKVLLSYRETPELTTALGDWNHDSFPVYRSIGGRLTARGVTMESLFYNYTDLAAETL